MCVRACVVKYTYTCVCMLSEKGPKSRSVRSVTVYDFTHTRFKYHHTTTLLHYNTTTTDQVNTTNYNTITLHNNISTTTLFITAQHQSQCGDSPQSTCRHPGAKCLNCYLLLIMHFHQYLSTHTHITRTHAHLHCTHAIIKYSLQFSFKVVQ